jgi:antitoxin YefM
VETLSLSEAKINLSRLVDKVNTTDEEIVITKNGRPAAVLVSPDEFEGWKETLLIRSDHGFHKEIRKGIKVLKQNKAKLYTLEELFEE